MSELNNSDKIVELLFGLAGLVKKGIDEGSKVEVNLSVNLVPKNDISPPTGSGSSGVQMTNPKLNDEQRSGDE